MPRYIVPHHGGLKYVRAIPVKVQPLEGRKVWTAYLKGLSGADAKTRALELAAEHDKRAKALLSLPESDKKMLISRGGLARCQADAAHADYLAAVLWPYTLVKPASEHASKLAQGARRSIASLSEAHATTNNIVAKLNGKEGSDPRLFELVALWQRVAKPRAPKSIDKMKMHVRRFVELIGDHAPRDVTRQHAIDYRDGLEKRAGLSAKSVDKHLYGMHRLYSVALSEGAADLNPFSGVKARKGDNGKFADDGRKPFTSTHARLIFKRLAELQPDDQIVMRLLAYHGMRAGEVCQLRACDVQRLGGVDVVSINDAAGSIKNKPSLRDVPLHPKCRDLLKLAKSKAPDAYLFDYPMWKHSRAGKFQQRANAWLRAIGITDKNITVHSWRHTWRTMARELDMPEPISRAILGHTLGSGDHGKYGEAPSLKLRTNWLAKVDPLNG
jgi:integrase